MNKPGVENDMIKVAGCRSNGKNQTGAVIVTMAVILTVLLGFTAFAIDIGYRMVTKNELQNVADSTALAAAGKLGAIYRGMNYAEQQSYVCDPAEIVAVAQDVGQKNRAATKLIEINEADVEIGRWSTGVFSLTLSQPNAVRVTARRDDNANGPVPTFFAGILGVDLLDTSATATAALTGQSTSEPGELELPVGISRAWFDSHPGVPCGDHIKFYPTTDPDACAGWTTFTENANTSNLRNILDGVLISDPTVAGETDFEFTGGVSAASFSNLILLFKRQGHDVDSNGDWIYDATGNLVRFATEAQGAVPLEVSINGIPTLLYYPADENDPDYPAPAQRPRNKHAWETTVAVYENDDGTADCDNPNQTKPIVGYARIRLTDVVDAPDKLVVGELVCDYVDNEDTRGGGGEGFSLMGSIPGLVK